MLNEFDDLLTVEEVCCILSVGKNTAYHLLTTAEIPAFKIGRLWRIPKQAVADYIASYGGRQTSSELF